MEYENLTLTRDGAVATLTLNRPEVRNALDLATWQELEAVLDALATDESIHVLIITGSGDRAFAAGADLRWLRERTMLATLDASVQRVLNKLEHLHKPTIAAVNGYALGGGCELAIACDIRIASERAKFGQPEVRLGILPAGGGTQRLPRLVGVAKAKELIFTGDIIDAREAERIGLANQVVSQETLMASAREMADKIVQRGPVAVRLAKVAIEAGINYGPGAGSLSEQLGQTILFGTRDRIEGISAFLENRPPNFEGR